ncbi:MAG: protein adenylyltransferase SelO family protein, partial [Mycobacterium sp.]|uniref:protein adenylyltransferase SelO family protein n=1 Tax=Mycobacterium sp. TaxID=1785 RepID=UPI003CC5FBD8
DTEEAVALAERAFEQFRPRYELAWSSGVRGKLGLSPGADADIVTPLTDDLLALLQQNHIDYTSFFRHLGQAARGETEPARGLFVDLAGFDGWLSRWQALNPDAESMDRTNPIYIPRNHLVEEALTAATAGDLAPLEQLLRVLADPYDERPGLEHYTGPAPEDFGVYRTFCGT